MPYRLLNGVYAVRCRHEHCPFNDHIKIEHEILGVTEEDVRSEALKMAHDQATVKHDSIYGRRHDLESPDIRMVSGTIQRLGGIMADAGSRRGFAVRRFKRGEVILRKGDTAAAICEVLEGSAYPRTNRSHRYRVGDCFGVAALVPNRKRLSDVIAASDDTLVAFYHLNDLREVEPARASSLVSRLMEDTLRVVDELGRAAVRASRAGHRLAS